MKWFKHDANASTDAKLRKVRIKYGMEGYGLYWYCLELVAANVEKHNLSFELEHDAEIIAHDTGIHFERVEEMMRYMVNLNLFEDSAGRITCLKMATRTDEYTQKLLRDLESVPRVSRHYPDTAPTKSLLIEEKRREENRTDKKKKEAANATRFTPPTVAEVSEYITTNQYPVDPNRFVDFYESKDWMVGKNKMKSWQAAVRTWSANNDKPNQSSGGNAAPKQTAAQRIAARRLELTTQSPDMGNLAAHDGDVRPPLDQPAGGGAERYMASRTA